MRATIASSSGCISGSPPLMVTMAVPSPASRSMRSHHVRQRHRAWTPRRIRCSRRRPGCTGASGSGGRAAGGRGAQGRAPSARPRARIGTLVARVASVSGEPPRRAPMITEPGPRSIHDARRVRDQSIAATGAGRLAALTFARVGPLDCFALAGRQGARWDSSRRSSSASPTTPYCSSSSAASWRTTSRRSAASSAASCDPARGSAPWTSAAAPAPSPTCSWATTTTAWTSTRATSTTRGARARARSSSATPARWTCPTAASTRS